MQDKTSSPKPILPTTPPPPPSDAWSDLQEQDRQNILTALDKLAAYGVSASVISAARARLER